MKKLKVRITYPNSHDANGIIINRVIEEDNAILIDYCNIIEDEEENEQYNIIYSNAFLRLDENLPELTESELLYIRMPIEIDELNTLTVPKLDDFISQIELTDEVDIIVPEPRLKADKIQAILDFEELS